MSTAPVDARPIDKVVGPRTLARCEWNGQLEQVTFNILLAWVLTLPMAAAIAALVYKVIAFF